MSEQDLFVKWIRTEFHPKNRAARAVLFEEMIIPRFREDVITLFTPWGPRYGWKNRGVMIAENDSEYRLLTHLAGLYDQIRNRAEGRQIDWVFLAADLYGTRINDLPADIVSEYFANLERVIALVLPIARFEYWSDYDVTASVYRQAIKSAIESMFCQIDENLFKRAKTTASKFQESGDPTDYLIERATEAILIEEKYHPIKISCAPRHKDDKVDLNLPRLYVVPENLMAPWL